MTKNAGDEGDEGDVANWMGATGGSFRIYYG
jgi:hypothetical protein